MTMRHALGWHAAGSPIATRYGCLSGLAATYAAHPMDAPPEPLTPKEHHRLVEIISRVAPDLLPLARDVVNTRWLTEDECEALTAALYNVLMDFLGRNDEASREGVEVDDLLGRVYMQRRNYWR